MVQAKQKIKSRWLSWAEAFAMSPLELGVAVLLVFSFLSGVQAHLMPAVYPVTRYTTDPLLLVVCLGLLYLIYQRQQDKRLWAWATVTYIGTFATEAITYLPCQHFKVQKRNEIYCTISVKYSVSGDLRGVLIETHFELYLIMYLTYHMII